MNSNVVYDPTNSKFYIKLSEKPAAEGVLLYEKIGDKQYDFYHTEVPIEYRGRGLAGQLARKAFDYIIAENATVIFSCTYLQKFGLSLSVEEQQHVVGAGGL